MKKVGGNFPTLLEEREKQREVKGPGVIWGRRRNADWDWAPNLVPAGSPPLPSSRPLKSTTAEARALSRALVFRSWCYGSVRRKTLCKSFSLSGPQFPHLSGASMR